jgi:alpha-tubulin suppressor-like RCC1 family protein
MGKVSIRWAAPAAAWVVAAGSWLACSGGSSGEATPDAGGTDATSSNDAPQSEAGGETDSASGTTPDAADGSTNPPAPDAGDSGAADADTVDADAATAPPRCLVDASSPYLVDAIDLSAGADFACAVRQDGTVACWGNSPEGMAGTTTGSTRPTTVVFPADAGAVHVVRAVVSASAACALDTTGGVWCWGYGPEIGAGTASVPFANPVPSPVVDSSGVPIHAVGLGNGYDHFCALEATGAVECWGRNDHGQLGTDAGADAGGYSLFAAPVPGVNLAGGSLAVGGAGFFSCGANASTGACWGANDNGQCANAVSASPSLNTNVLGALSEAGAALPLSQMSDGLYSACAIDHQGQLFCWGSNVDEQRGDLDAATGSPPNAVGSLADAGITTVSCGYDLACVIDANHHARCFGSNSTYGFLGNGSLDGSTAVPGTVVDVDGGAALFPVARIAAGGDESCAIVAGSCGPDGPGAVVCWGWNGSHNLGDPEAGTSAVPIRVLAP